MKKKILVVGVIVLFFLWLFLNINHFIYLQNSEYSDIPITHYPNILLIQNSIKEFGQIPLWSNQIFSGTPFSNNPLSGLWYLPNWIAVVLPLPFGINFLILLHLLFGVWGFYKFLRIEGRSFEAALFGALSFFAGAKIISHIGAGHFSLICAMSWTPWVLFFTRKDFRNHTRLSFIPVGVSLGMLISADPRWIVPAGVLWVLYAFSILDLKKPINPSKIFQFILDLLKSTLTALVLSAAVWLPMLSTIGLTTRSGLSVEDNLVYSFGLNKIFGFFFPDFGGFAEWIVYPAAIMLLLVVLTFFLYKENRPLRIWFYAAGLSLLLSLGENLPFNQFVFDIPILNLLRVPSRFLFLTLFSFSVMGAFAFDYLKDRQGSYKFDRLFFLTPVAAFVVILTVGVSILTPDSPKNFYWGMIFTIISFVFIGFSIHKKIPGKWFSLLSFGLLLIDLGGVNYLSLDFYTKNQLIPEPDLTLKTLDVGIPYRVYSPSYALTQEKAAFWGVRQVNGIDPMQIKDYAAYFEEASNIPIPGYTVTLPPFEGGDPHETNRVYCPEPELLQRLTVKYIISDFAFYGCSGLPVPDKVQDTYIYELIPEWAWQTNGDIIQEIPLNEIEFIEYTPNKLNFVVRTKGEITFSEIYDPYWRVWVNGKESTLKANGIFRSVFLTEDYNQIEMIYAPTLTWIGLGIEGFSWIILGLLWIQRKKIH